MFDRKTQAFLKKNSKITEVNVQGYTNLRAIDVLWKPFEYKVATSTPQSVTLVSTNQSTTKRIKEIFQAADVRKEGKPATPEELFDCQTSKVIDELSIFIQKLIFAQIFFNRISFHPERQKMEFSGTTNNHTNYPPYQTLVERYFYKFNVLTRRGLMRSQAYSVTVQSLPMSLL